MKITESKVFQYNIKNMIRKYKSINLKQISVTYRQNIQELIKLIRDRKLVTNKKINKFIDE